MSENLPPEDSKQTELPWMSLPEVSRAKTSQSRVNKPELKTAPAAVSGPRSSDSLATYDRATSSWRTSQTCLLARLIGGAGGLAEYSETWPKSGMTRNGTAYQLQPLVPVITENGSGLLPTVVAREPRDWSRPSILARLDRGDGVAKRICAQCTPPLSDEAPVGLNPSFAEWMMGYPIGWTE